MRTHFVAAALAVAVSVAALVAPAPAAAQQKFITVGTGGIVGVYYPLGGAICRFVNAGRKDHNLRCTVESTGGSVFNINSVMSGDMDVGFAQSDTQYYALKGEGPFKDKAQPKLRALFSVYPELFTLVARQDANIKRFEDIKGKRINIGDPGSGTRATMELVMKEFGINAADLKLATELKFVEMAPALCDNKIDAFVFVAGHPNAIFQEAATSCASTIAAVSGPPINKLVAVEPLLRQGRYPGQDVQGYRRRAAVVRRACHRRGERRHARGDRLCDHQGRVRQFRRLQEAASGDRQHHEGRIAVGQHGSLPPRRREVFQGKGPDEADAASHEAAIAQRAPEGARSHFRVAARLMRGAGRRST